MTISSDPQSSPSRPAHLRKSNARRLLHLLREHNPCSRADLVRVSELSAPTVSSGVAFLERLGLVEFMGDASSRGGRPPGLLRFNAARGVVAAADIGGTHLRLMLADLNGSALAQQSVILSDSEKTPQAICALIHEGLHTLSRECHTDLRDIMHLTAGAPGVTNVDSGIVLAAPNLIDWNDVPLRDLLAAETGLRVTVENDTNLAALGEHYRGVVAGIENFVFLAVGTGVGAGIFLHGRLHHGARWTAGEIGYFRIRGADPETLRMRETGQLERAIGGVGIERQWRAALARSSHLPDQDLVNLRPTDIFDRACNGDFLAVAVISTVTTLLADTIAEIALLLNPEVVVLGGGIGSHPELCRRTEVFLKRHEIAQPILRSSSLGTSAQLLGAIFLSLEATENHLFS